MTTDHQHFDELAVGWALHALEPEDEGFFAAHLAGCARCTATVAETTEVMAAMASDLPQAEPSPELRHRLRAAVEETDQVSGPAPAPVPQPAAGRPGPAPVPAPSQPRSPAQSRSPASAPGPSTGPGRDWRRVLPAGLVAAAVAAILGLGIWNVALNSQRQELEAAVAEQSAVLDGLLTPGRATIAPLDSDGRPVATVVARGDEVQVVTHGLQVNQARSTTYVLWGLDGDQATALGTFDVTRSQTDMKTVGSGLTGLDEFPSYGISLEPGQEAPSAPTEVVATGQVTS
jgi:Anti-sigma-K factor rskA